MSGWEQGWGLEFLVFMSDFGGRGLDLALEPFHWIGGQAGYLIALPILFWCIDDRMGRRLMALALGSALVNGILKAWWARPRPYEIAPDRIDPVHYEESRGMPSGHAQGGTVLGLFFAAQSRKTWVKALMAALIVLMGVSRMIHGVHFLQDVLSGWLVGITVFGLFILLEKPLAEGLAAASTKALALLALLPILIALGAESALEASFPDTGNLLAIGGAFSGVLLGLVLEKSRGVYRSAGPVWKRLLRAPLGLGLVVGVHLLMSWAYHALFPAVRPGLPGVAAYAFRFVPTGFAGSWLAPELLVRIGLADSRDSA